MSEGSLVVRPLDLMWTINRRFQHYVAHTAAGRCTVEDGATVAGGDVFCYEAAEQPHPGQFRFRGRVQFAGHHGFLRVAVADPWLELHGDPGDPSRGVDGVPAELTIAAQPEESGRLHLADLVLRPGRLEVLVGSEVRLTAAGAELFGGSYPRGTPFDDLVVRTRSAANP